MGVFCFVLFLRALERVECTGVHTKEREREAKGILPNDHQYWLIRYMSEKDREG